MSENHSNYFPYKVADISLADFGRKEIEIAESELRGISEETTTGVHRLYQMLERGELLLPACIWLILAWN